MTKEMIMPGTIVKLFYIEVCIRDDDSTSEKKHEIPATVKRNSHCIISHL